MKHKTILLLCLLVGPALARPNSEPIFYRSNSNPLEVTEEMIPTTNALPLVASGDNADHQTSTGASSVNDANPAAPTVAPGTTTTTTTTTPAPSTSAQDHISRYTKYADDALSNESIIKDFIIKNLANFQQDNIGAGNYDMLPSLTEEPNTLRSVSLAPVAQTSPNWDPPDSQYHYMNVRKKPIIHKIITKWSDKTQDAFNVDFNGQHGIVTPIHLLNSFGSTTGFFQFPTSTPASVIIVAKPVYPEVSNDQVELSFSDDGYTPEPERDEFPLPQENIYPSQADPIDVYSEPSKKKKKKKKNKNKKKKPEKQQADVDSDPDRPDATYWNDVEQIEPSGWQQQTDPYGDDAPSDPYDDLGALKDEEVVENEDPKCTGIRITVNGKEACNDIEIAINEPQRDAITKSGSPLAPAVAAAAPVAAAAAIAGSSLAANPQAAAGASFAASSLAADTPAAAGASVASDASLFAAPLEPLISAPVFPPVLPPAPLASFLSTPIGNLVGNIMQPTRLGTSPGTSSGGHNKHKKPHDSGESGVSSILPDTSHALFGMMAAMSAMTPMNIIIVALAALPVVAMVMTSVGLGMYFYSKFTPPIKNYSTIVVKKPLPVGPFHRVHRKHRPVQKPSQTGWFDFGNMWSQLGFVDDRRSIGKKERPDGGGQKVSQLSPYRGHKGAKR